MKSFRIPMTRMVLSEDALRTAIEVNSIRDAEEFLDAFGSHVSNGRQEVRQTFRSGLRSRGDILRLEIRLSLSLSLS